MKVQLTKDEADRLRRPVTGTGGFQTLLRKLQSQLSDDDVLVLTDDDAEKCARYFVSYGQGGFQNRIEPSADHVSEEE